MRGTRMPREQRTEDVLGKGVEQIQDAPKGHLKPNWKG